jgi:hypothetical protein
MSRYVQKLGQKGSQRWLQYYVNYAPSIVNAAIGIGRIEWLSPLASDEYAEYRDQAFLNLLGVALHKRPLEAFWPSKGPQWDALGRSESGVCVLVEAKAHIAEIFSPPMAASKESAHEIQRALDETKAALGAMPGLDWSQRFYQYANRLAHAYLLTQLNGVPTLLVFLYFVGDLEMRGPASRAEWESAIQVVHEALGMRGRMPKFVRDAFLQASQLQI